MIHIMLGRKSDLEGSSTQPPSTEPPSTEGRKKTKRQRSKQEPFKWMDKQTRVSHTTLKYNDKKES